VKYYNIKLFICRGYRGLIGVDVVMTFSTVGYTSFTMTNKVSLIHWCKYYLYF